MLVGMSSWWTLGSSVVHQAMINPNQELSVSTIPSSKFPSPPCLKSMVLKFTCVLESLESSEWHRPQAPEILISRSGVEPGHGYFVSSLDDSSVEPGMRTTVTVNPGRVPEHCFSPAFSGEAVYLPSCPLLTVLGSEVGVLTSQSISPSLQKLPNLWRLCPTHTLVLSSTDLIFTQSFKDLALVPPPVTIRGSVGIHLTTNPLRLSSLLPHLHCPFPSLAHLCLPPHLTPSGPPAEPYYEKSLHLLNR